MAALIFVIAAISFSDIFINIFDFSSDPLQLKLLIGIIALDTLMVVPFAYLRASNRPVKYALIKLINVGIIVVINLVFLKFIPEFKDCLNSSDLTAEKTELFSSVSVFILPKNEEPSETRALLSGALRCETRRRG